MAMDYGYMGYQYMVILISICTTINLAERSSDFGKNVWQRKGDIRAPLALTQCHKDNRQRMERCVDQSFDSWKYYEKLKYENEQQLTKASCCAMWDSRDCQMKIAKHECNDEAVKELYDSWEEAIQLWTRVSNCYQYSYYYNSAKCKLTDWAIALIVVASLLIIAIIVFFTIRCIRRRNTRKSLTFSSVNYRQ